MSIELNCRLTDTFAPRAKTKLVTKFVYNIVSRIKINLFIPIADFTDVQARLFV